MEQRRYIVRVSRDFNRSLGGLGVCCEILPEKKR